MKTWKVSGFYSGICRGWARGQASGAGLGRWWKEKGLGRVPDSRARRHKYLASKMREGEKGSRARRLSDKMTCPSDAATLRNSIQRCDTIPLYMEDIAAPSAVQDDLVLFYGNSGGLPTEHRRVTERELKGGRERWASRLLIPM